MRLLKLEINASTMNYTRIVTSQDVRRSKITTR